LNYWLLTTEYPPFHGGGISTYCRFTSGMLSAAGHSVTVFVPDDSVSDRNIDDVSGITQIRFNSNRNKLHASLGYTARLAYAFADIVRTRIEEEGSPDLIEAQDYLGIAYYLTQFKHTGYPFMQGIPILITLHSPAFIYLEYNRTPVDRFPDFWTGEMEKQAIRAADLLISPTRFLAEEIQKFMDISGLPVHMLPNPYVQGSPGNLLSDRPVQRNKIVYYGKLSRQKGSFELLAYFRELWDEGFPHALHIIGGTDIIYHPERLTMGQWVEREYKKYIDTGFLQLHGKISPDETAHSLRDAHVIIFPSIVDNLPYVVMEAMSLGKTVLASRQGGQREMIEEGVDGFLFDHNEPDSFSRQLLAILALSDAALEQIGLNAQSSVRHHYDPTHILPAKMALLEPLVGPGRSSAKPSLSAAVPPLPRRHFPFLHQEAFTPLPSPAGSLLSVVIPYYNMGAYIEKCVHSVLASGYPSIEILIIDDGSTEKDSLEKLRQLASPNWLSAGISGNNTRNISILHQKNAGLANSRNKGALAAKGDFLAFLDADDKVDPAYYEKAIRALQFNENVFFAGSWVQFFGDSYALWPSFTPQPPYALVHNPLNSSGLVYKKAAFLAEGLNDKKADYGLEDYASVVGMLSHGLNGVVLPEALFHYRVRRGSMFRHVTREKFMFSYKYILEQNKPYYTKFAAGIINLLNANGPGYQFDNPSFGVQVSTTVEKDGLLIRQLKSVIKKSEKLKRIAVILNNTLRSKK
jgi:glycosyltransferase involved in cell wall biosynthesis